MRSTRGASIIVVGSLLLAACGGGSSADSAEQGDAAPLTEAPAVSDADDATADTGGDDGATADAAPAALQFNAPLVGGGELDASTLAGKPTVFWFWAPT